MFLGKKKVRSTSENMFSVVLQIIFKVHNTLAIYWFSKIKTHAINSVYLILKRRIYVLKEGLYVSKVSWLSFLSKTCSVLKRFHSGFDTLSSKDNVVHNIPIQIFQTICPLIAV